MESRTRPFALSTAMLALACGMPAKAAAMPAGTVRLVGPGHPYAKPCQAIRASRPGDIVRIDAAGNGSYDGDVCAWSTDRLTIIGYNGRAHIDAAGNSSQDKAIWVIAGNDTVIRNVELSGAAASSRNGAGIRQEGANLRLERCYFHDNENGLLAGANPASDILIESSEFARNGHGDGYSHNLYIGKVRRFTLRYSYSHDARAGHLVKSRALTNHILYNRLTGEAGTGSYELDLPNAGLAYVIGNVFQQGTGTQNPSLVAYGEEGEPAPNPRLYFVNNTLVNGLGRGAALKVEASVAPAVLAQNNLSVGSPAFISAPGASLKTNCMAGDPAFENPAAHDYHLRKGSPCIDAGSEPGSGRDLPLSPSHQYVYDRGHVRRRTVGKAIDAGAFEYGN
jgi:hypothetical protein